MTRIARIGYSDQKTRNSKHEVRNNSDKRSRARENFRCYLIGKSETALVSIIPFSVIRALFRISIFEFRNCRRALASSIREIRVIRGSFSSSRGRSVSTDCRAGASPAGLFRFGNRRGSDKRSRARVSSPAREFFRPDSGGWETAPWVFDRRPWKTLRLGQTPRRVSLGTGQGDRRRTCLEILPAPKFSNCLLDT